MRPYWLRVGIAILCMLLFSLTSGALAFLIGPAMKLLFSAGTSTGETISFIPFNLASVPQELLTLAIPIAIIVFSIIKGLASYGNAYFMGSVGQRLIADFRLTLYKHILKLPIGFFASNQSGGLSSRIFSDIAMLQQTLAVTLTNLLKQLLTLIVLASIVLSMDFELALVAAIGFPLCVYPALWLGKKIKKISKRGQISIASMFDIITETFSAVRIVKAFGMEPFEAKRFEGENNHYTRQMIRSVKVKGLSVPIMETLGAFGFAVTIYYAAHRIGSGTLKPEDFVTFFAAVLMMYQPIRALSNVNISIQQGLVSAIRVFEILDTPTEPLDTAGKIEVTTLNKEIEFKDVQFSYGKKGILKSINLRIKKGETIAIVGASGAGKTTLVNLIPRFFETTSGALLIDGTDIKDFSMKSLRSLIAIISQDVILFNDTIYNNISYGDASNTEASVIKAARTANAEDFINGLPEKYETLAGERGTRLSGGERQRISIARAILKNAPILIMDEATSSLDTESEYEVQKGIANLMRGRTAFVIAHRLSTVQNASRIIVLSEGVIVESGTHEELLKIGGEYSRLYSMQFKDAREDKKKEGDGNL